MIAVNLLFNLLSLLIIVCLHKDVALLEDMQLVLSLVLVFFKELSAY